MIEVHKKTEYINVNKKEYEYVETEVIVESPVSLTVNGKVWLSFMCTPSDLDALAVGFLYNEGLIKTFEEVASVRICPNGKNVDVWLHHNIEEPSEWRRTSGCTGGLTTVELDAFDKELLENKVPISKTFTPNQINKLTEMLFDSQSLYRKSGGVHTSALADNNEIILITEDIGRHNTLDKIAGRKLLDRIVTTDNILLTTGRISSDMLQKAARIRSPLIISRTSPSSLSITMAEVMGITIIGYARRSNFRVYTHPRRISLPEK
jgi:FdhD protein